MKGIQRVRSKISNPRSGQDSLTIGCVLTFMSKAAVQAAFFSWRDALSREAHTAPIYGGKEWPLSWFSKILQKEECNVIIRSHTFCSSTALLTLPQKEEQLHPCPCSVLFWGWRLWPSRGKRMKAREVAGGGQWDKIHDQFLLSLSLQSLWRLTQEKTEGAGTANEWLNHAAQAGCYRRQGKDCSWWTGLDPQEVRAGREEGLGIGFLHEVGNCLLVQFLLILHNSIHSRAR